MTIPDEAVEAAYDVSQHLLITTAEIELILEAAAPFIAAEAWDEGFEKGTDWGDWAAAPVTPEPDSTNPYRSGA